MKLIILQNKLKQGLSVIERASSKSFILPILRNLLLKAEKNFLELSATDLEIGIKWWSLVKRSSVFVPMGTTKENLRREAYNAGTGCQQG